MYKSEGSDSKCGQVCSGAFQHTQKTARLSYPAAELQQLSWAGCPDGVQSGRGGHGFGLDFGFFKQIVTSCNTFRTIRHLSQWVHLDTWVLYTGTHPQQDPAVKQSPLLPQGSDMTTGTSCGNITKADWQYHLGVKSAPWTFFCRVYIHPVMLNAT